MKYIIGGTYRAALDFCKVHGIRAQSKDVKVLTVSQVANGSLKGVALSVTDEIYTNALSLGTYEDVSRATREIDIITNRPRREA